MSHLFFGRLAASAAFFCLFLAPPLAALPQVPDPVSTSTSPASTRMDLRDIVQCLSRSSETASPTAPLHLCDSVVFYKASDQNAVVFEEDKMRACALNANARESDPLSYAFVHALAVPFAPVTGVEQADACPPGVWDLAWREAARYILKESEIVLVVNQPRYRTQDQLHIHLARLKPGSRDAVLHPSPGDRRVPPAYVDSLAGSPDPVWAAAERNAAELAAKLGLAPGLTSGAFGVAVVQDEDRARFAVVAVADDSPEWDFIAACPGQ